MSAHTLAPWKTQNCVNGGLILLKELADQRHPQSHLQIVPSADAQLMAAAPDLLEALEAVMPYIIGDRVVPWRAAQAAIAKAKNLPSEC